MERTMKLGDAQRHRNADARTAVLTIERRVLHLFVLLLALMIARPDLGGAFCFAAGAFPPFTPLYPPYICSGNISPRIDVWSTVFESKLGFLANSSCAFEPTSFIRVRPLLWMQKAAANREAEYAYLMNFLGNYTAVPRSSMASTGDSDSPAPTGVDGGGGGGAADGVRKSFSTAAASSFSSAADLLLSPPLAAEAYNYIPVHLIGMKGSAQSVNLQVHVASSYVPEPWDWPPRVDLPPSLSAAIASPDFPFVLASQYGVVGASGSKLDLFPAADIVAVPDPKPFALHILVKDCEFWRDATELSVADEKGFVMIREALPPGSRIDIINTKFDWVADKYSTNTRSIFYFFTTFELFSVLIQLVDSTILMENGAHSIVLGGYAPFLFSNHSLFRMTNCDVDYAVKSDTAAYIAVFSFGTFVPITLSNYSFFNISFNRFSAKITDSAVLSRFHIMGFNKESEAHTITSFSGLLWCQNYVRVNGIPDGGNHVMLHANVQQIATFRFGNVKLESHGFIAIEDNDEMLSARFQTAVINLFAYVNIGRYISAGSKFVIGSSPAADSYLHRPAHFRIRRNKIQLKSFGGHVAIRAVSFDGELLIMKHSAPPFLDSFKNKDLDSPPIPPSTEASSAPPLFFGNGNATQLEFSRHRFLEDGGVALPADQPNTNNNLYVPPRAAMFLITDNDVLIEYSTMTGIERLWYASDYGHLVSSHVAVEFISGAVFCIHNNTFKVDLGRVGVLTNLNFVEFGSIKHQLVANDALADGDVHSFGSGGFRVQHNKLSGMFYFKSIDPGIAQSVFFQLASNMITLDTEGITPAMAATSAIVNGQKLLSVCADTVNATSTMLTQAFFNPTTDPITFSSAEQYQTIFPNVSPFSNEPTAADAPFAYRCVYDDSFYYTDNATVSPTTTTTTTRAPTTTTPAPTLPTTTTPATTTTIPSTTTTSLPTRTTILTTTTTLPTTTAAPITPRQVVRLSGCDIFSLYHRSSSGGDGGSTSKSSSTAVDRFAGGGTSRCARIPYSFWNDDARRQVAAQRRGGGGGDFTNADVSDDGFAFIDDPFASSLEKDYSITAEGSSEASLTVRISVNALVSNSIRAKSNGKYALALRKDLFSFVAGGDGSGGGGDADINAFLSSVTSAVRVTGDVTRTSWQLKTRKRSDSSSITSRTFQILGNAEDEDESFIEVKAVSARLPGTLNGLYTARSLQITVNMSTLLNSTARPPPLSPSAAAAAATQQQDPLTATEPIFSFVDWPISTISFTLEAPTVSVASTASAIVGVIGGVALPTAASQTAVLQAVVRIIRCENDPCEMSLLAHPLRFRVGIIGGAGSWLMRTRRTAAFRKSTENDNNDMNETDMATTTANGTTFANDTESPTADDAGVASEFLESFEAFDDDPYTLEGDCLSAYRGAVIGNGLLLVPLSAVVWIFVANCVYLLKAMVRCVVGDGGEIVATAEEGANNSNSSNSKSKQHKQRTPQHQNNSKAGNALRRYWRVTVEILYEYLCWPGVLAVLPMIVAEGQAVASVVLLRSYQGVVFAGDADGDGMDGAGGGSGGSGAGPQSSSSTETIVNYSFPNGTWHLSRIAGNVSSLASSSLYNADGRPVDGASPHDGRSEEQRLVDLLLGVLGLLSLAIFILFWVVSLKPLMLPMGSMVLKRHEIAELDLRELMGGDQGGGGGAGNAADTTNTSTTSVGDHNQQQQQPLLKASGEETTVVNSTEENNGDDDTATATFSSASSFARFLIYCCRRVIEPTHDWVESPETMRRIEEESRRRVSMLKHQLRAEQHRLREERKENKEKEKGECEDERENDRNKSNGDRLATPSVDGDGPVTESNKNELSKNSRAARAKERGENAEEEEEQRGGEDPSLRTAMVAAAEYLAIRAHRRRSIISFFDGSTREEGRHVLNRLQRLSGGGGGVKRARRRKLASSSSSSSSDNENTEINCSTSNIKCDGEKGDKRIMLLGDGHFSNLSELQEHEASSSFTGISMGVHLFVAANGGEDGRDSNTHFNFECCDRPADKSRDHHRHRHPHATDELNLLLGVKESIRNDASPSPSLSRRFARRRRAVHLMKDDGEEGEKELEEFPLLPTVETNLVVAGLAKVNPNDVPNNAKPTTKKRHATMMSSAVSSDCEDQKLRDAPSSDSEEDQRSRTQRLSSFSSPAYSPSAAAFLLSSSPRRDRRSSTLASCSSALSAAIDERDSTIHPLSHRIGTLSHMVGEVRWIPYECFSFIIACGIGFIEGSDSSSTAACQTQATFMLVLVGAHSLLTMGYLIALIPIEMVFLALVSCFSLVMSIVGVVAVYTYEPASAVELVQFVQSANDAAAWTMIAGIALSIALSVFAAVIDRWERWVLERRVTAALIAFAMEQQKSIVF